MEHDETWWNCINLIDNISFSCSHDLAFELERWKTNTSSLLPWCTQNAFTLLVFHPARFAQKRAKHRIYNNLGKKLDLWHIISITHLCHYNTVSLTWSVRFICMLLCLPAPTNRLGISCCLCSTSFWNHSHTPISPRLCIMLPMTSDRKGFLWCKRWLWVPFKHPI